MIDLSLSAEMIMNAYIQGLAVKRRLAIAAALETAATQADPKIHISDIDYQHQMYTDGWNDALEIIRDLACELAKSNSLTKETHD
jgi:hypothetical protein